MEIKKFTRLSMLLALAIVLNIIESFIPFFNGIIPGLRLGLANTITLLVLFIYGFKDAFTLSILRVFLVGILRTGLFSFPFFFSFGGVVLSLFMMQLVKKTGLSIIGISMIGSISHCVGQIIMAYFLLNTSSILYYLPWLLLFSLPTGIIIGFISKELVNYFQKRLKF